ncbi:MAG TPA: metal-dependent transcriptional regulator, partial [Ignavibacteria bacterium]|nr:metal-dependent transcriptional regulator [Ignavibacteria bacterium]
MNRSIEDYIKNIYTIKQAVGRVTTSALAEVLSVSPAAVSEMISKLSKSGHIKNTPYKGFELTKNGEKIALNLIRKHRL